MSQANARTKPAESLRRREKERDVRRSNIIAARALADTVRTSLGPKGVRFTILFDVCLARALTNDFILDGQNDNW